MTIIIKTSEIKLQQQLFLIVFLFLIVASPLAFGQKTFEYTGPEMGTRNNLPPGWDYQTNSDNPHGVIVVLGANPRINEIPLSPGDFIGAFYIDDNGDLKCGGADVWLGDENIIFPVFGNDPSTPEKDGFGYAEVMNFKVFYQATQKEYSVDLVQWDPGYTTTNKWYPLGLSSITNMACVVTFDAFASATPNPVCQGETINLEAHIFVATNGNYTFQWWSEPAGFFSSLQYATDIPNSNTVYFLEVSDGVNVSDHQLTMVVNENPNVDAGADKTICAGQTLQPIGSGSNYSGVSWTTSGDGTFAGAQTFSPTYYPGVLDIANAGTSLTLTAFPLAACVGSTTDEMNVIIVPQPEVSVPSSLEFCEGEPMIVMAEALNNSAVFWTTNGDGTFSNPSNLITQYFPGTTDLILDEFMLTVCATPLTPCTSNACDAVLITTHNMPTVTAPGSRLGCAGNPVNLNSIANGHSSSLWVTSGDGTFLNPALLNTKYYPGSQDVSNGGTVVTVRVYGTGVCEEYYASKNIQIILNQLPVANAGVDISVCHSSSVQLEGSATAASLVSWATSGDGIFSNTNLPDAVYFPGSVDVSTGSVSLYLTASAVYPCTMPDTDTLDVEILPLPFVGIGLNQASVCFGENFLFDQTIASNYGSLSWITVNGGGTFDDNTALHPTYYPNPGIDYPNGCIIIGVMANSIDPCTAVDEDYMNLCFNALPEIDAGDDLTIIATESAALHASGSNFTAVSWSTLGDGTFNNSTLLETEYFPGEADIENYIVKLVIEAEPVSGCSLLITDTLTLTILRSQSIILPEGVSGFSSYIDLSEKSFVEVMNPVAGKLIFAQNMTNIYWPEYGINSINSFSDHTGYKVLMNNSGTLQIVGYEISDKMIELQQGWNVLPVFSSCSITAQQLIDRLGSSLIIVSEMSGDKIIWPAGNVFTLTELIPGKAYMVKLSENISFLSSGCE